MITSWSAIPLPDQAVVVFDLDDTLYPERDFVRSGFQAVAALFPRAVEAVVNERLVELFADGRSDPYSAVLSEFGGDDLGIFKAQMIAAYREHRPRLTLSTRAADLLDELRAAGHPLAVITDGRQTTQQNKLQALGLHERFEVVAISEILGAGKPHERPFRYIQQQFPQRACVYVGNDTSKDFVAPNRLGWTTIGVRDAGTQLRKQAIAGVAPQCLPQFWVEALC